MQHRAFGRTGLQVPAISFGCGMVGGLMVNGNATQQRETVAQALDAGIDYFDTAPFYGAGQSEENLGRALRALGRSAIVGTKVRIEPALRDDPSRRADLAALVARSAEDSLRRLHVDCLDLLQLHNPISPAQAGSGLPARMVLEEVLPALHALQRAGKVKYIGLSALGDASAVAEVIAADGFDTAQVSYSLLNPSAATAPPPDAEMEDYGRLLERTARHKLGTIGIRLLAGGSLSGSTERHPGAMPRVIPLGQGAGSGHDYARDVDLGREFEFLVQEAGAGSLAEAALRYGLSHPQLHTLAIGFSSREQLAEAVRAAEAGPWDSHALERIRIVQERLSIAAPSPVLPQ